MTKPTKKSLLLEVRHRVLREDAPAITSGQTGAFVRLGGGNSENGLLADSSTFAVSNKAAFDIVELFQRLNEARWTLGEADANGVRYSISLQEATLEERQRMRPAGKAPKLDNYQPGPSDPKAGPWIKHSTLKISIVKDGRVTTVYYSLRPSEIRDVETEKPRMVFYLTVQCDPFLLHGGRQGRFVLPPTEVDDGRQYLIDFYSAGFWLLETLGRLKGVKPFQPHYKDRPRRFTWRNEERACLRRGDVSLKYVSVVKTRRVVGPEVGDLVQAMAEIYGVCQYRDDKTDQTVTWSPRALIGVDLEPLILSRPNGDYTKGFALVGREDSRNVRFRLEVRPKTKKDVLRLPTPGAHRKPKKNPPRSYVEVLAKIPQRWFYRHDSKAYQKVVATNNRSRALKILNLACEGRPFGFTMAAFVDLTIRSAEAEDTAIQVVQQHHFYLQNCMERILGEQTRLRELMSVNYDMIMALATPGCDPQADFGRQLNPSEVKLLTAWCQGKLHGRDDQFCEVKQIAEMLGMPAPTVYARMTSLRAKGIDVALPLKVYIAVGRRHRTAAMSLQDAAALDNPRTEALERQALQERVDRQRRKFESVLTRFADSLNSAKAAKPLRPQTVELRDRSCVVKPKRVGRRAELLIPQIESV